MNFRTLVLGALLLAPSAHAQAQAPAAPEAAAEDTRALRLFVAGRDAWLADAAKSSDGTTKAELEERAARLSKVLAEASDLRAQVLIGELVERDGKPVLVQHSWRADAQYFYPASTVKLLAAVAALERMRELQRGPAPKLDADTPLAFWPPRRGGAIVAQDSDNVTDGKLTLRHLVREALVVSDNESFNRLYEFTGHDRLNKLMWDAGLESVRITHRLNVKVSILENRRTPSIELRLPEGVVRLAEENGTLELANVDDRDGVMVGKGRMEDGDLVPGPMSFIAKSRVKLRDLQVALARVVRPDLTFDGKPFDLGEPERALLLEALSQYPGDSENPRWDRTKYPDDYVKFYLPGASRVVPKESLRIYNKVGLAYGFAIDNAYIVDQRSGRGFFLASAIYANFDGVLNDDKYDYESFALPWMSDVAELCAREFLATK